MTGIYENIQVGDAFDPPRASMWFWHRSLPHGMHPAGSDLSTARGVDASTQAGSVNFGTGLTHA